MVTNKKAYKWLIRQKTAVNNKMIERIEDILRKKENIQLIKKILEQTEKKLTKQYYEMHKVLNYEGLVGAALVFGNGILDNVRDNEDQLTKLPQMLKLERVYTLMRSLHNGDTHRVSDLKQTYKKQELGIEIIALGVYKPGGIDDSVKTLTESGKELIMFYGFNSKNYADNYYDMHKIAKELAGNGKISECHNKGRLEKVYTPIGEIAYTTE